jgi:hypothetical protein
LSADLYVWQAPRNVDAAAAEASIATWEAAGGDPAASPFAASSDVGWFHRELLHDHPTLDVTSDARPSRSRRPVWLETDSEPPARIVAIRIPASDWGEVLADIHALATKYDLVLFDRRAGRIGLPTDEMAALASATFWPDGAIQAGSAGGFGIAMAVIAWVVGLPILSGALVVVGAFLAVLAALTFAQEIRVRWRARRGRPRK